MSIQDNNTYSKAKVVEMKAKMEKAGLNVERFFRELEESSIVHAPRETAISFADKDDGIRSSKSSSTINGPVKEPTSRTQDTHSPTSSAKENPSREHDDDDDTSVDSQQLLELLKKRAIKGGV